MCEPCFDAELQNAHERAAKEPSYDKGWGRRPASYEWSMLNAQLFSQVKEDLPR